MGWAPAPPEHCRTSADLEQAKLSELHTRWHGQGPRSHGALLGASPCRAGAQHEWRTPTPHPWPRQRSPSAGAAANHAERTLQGHVSQHSALGAHECRTCRVAGRRTCRVAGRKVPGPLAAALAAREALPGIGQPLETPRARLLEQQQLQGLGVRGAASSARHGSGHASMRA
jgi:hypothetical protein